MGTQQIMGASDWEVSLSRGMITRTGHIKFDVEYIRAIFNMSQTLDTRNRPQINDVQLEIGNIQVCTKYRNWMLQIYFQFYSICVSQIRSDGAGTFDYIIEFVINFLPNLLRYQIMDAIEVPIRAKIQSEFNQINVERLIRSKLPDIEQLSKKSAHNLENFEL